MKRENCRVEKNKGMKRCCSLDFLLNTIVENGPIITIACIFSVRIIIILAYNMRI